MTSKLDRWNIDDYLRKLSTKIIMFHSRMKSFNNVVLNLFSSFRREFCNELASWLINRLNDLLFHTVT